MKVGPDDGRAGMPRRDLARQRERLLTLRVSVDRDRLPDVRRSERERRSPDSFVDGYEDPFRTTEETG